MRAFRRQSGFTLVELLTVVGIIALLIGILVPSLSKARDSAKRAAVKGALKAYGDNLEMFQNSFKQYPDSSEREDPITSNWPTDATDGALTGAHWLARAMLGHDFQGVDAKGMVMRDANDPKLTTEDKDYDTYKGKDRTTPFDLGSNAWALDDNSSKFPQTLDTHRPVLVDTYEFPILYYRANSRSRNAFSNVLSDATASPDERKQLGIYNHRDNARITGDGGSDAGWLFAPGTSEHPLGVPDGMTYNSGSSSYTYEDEYIKGEPGKEGCFINSLVDEDAYNATGGQVVKPVNPETFILISPGKDGRYGSRDDVTNFNRGL